MPIFFSMSVVNILSSPDNNVHILVIVLPVKNYE